MRLNKRDLLMLWRFSTFNSVREVAQNPDILKLIFTELEPMFQYNRVVTEYNDPRFKAHFKRVFKQAGSTSIHPGRWLVHIIYPQLCAWPYYATPEFKCEDINLYGCMIQTIKKRWSSTNGLSLQYDSMRSFTHDDLNQLLTSLGYTRFSSKKPPFISTMGALCPTSRSNSALICVC